MGSREPGGEGTSEKGLALRRWFCIAVRCHQGLQGVKGLLGGVCVGGFMSPNSSGELALFQHLLVLGHFIKHHL